MEIAIDAVMNKELTLIQMEAILGRDSEAFETFISYHYSYNSEETAKSMFNMMKQTNPESLALKLAYRLSPFYDISTRAVCAELLHELLNDDDLYTWLNLRVSTQSTIICMILDRMNHEDSEFIIQELLSTVSNLVINSPLPDNIWAELLPSLYRLLTSPTVAPRLKLLSIELFVKLADNIGETTTIPCIKDFHTPFLNILNDDTLHVGMRMLATRAVVALILRVPSSKEKERFQELLPGMMRALTDALNNGLEFLAQVMLSFLIVNLVKNEPRFFRRQVVDVVGTMFDIAEDKSLEEMTRHCAIEFVLTLVEAREKAPGMMKNLPLFTNTCFAVLLNLLLDVKDEPSWHISEDKVDEARETHNFIYGQAYLDRFSKALGGKTIAPIAIEQLSAYLVAPEWEKRHAALISLAQIAEGSSKVMMKYLEELVNMVLHAFQDPHPRVRWAAIKSIAQFSIDFCPHLQVQYHNLVLPALAAAMDDFQNPRVQARAAFAVFRFCESKELETLVPYLDRILNKLLVILQNYDNQIVQEAALLALTAIADLSKEQFQKYYASIMPYLITIQANANDKSNHMLLGRAFECISAVAVAAGKEKFRDDLLQVMEVLTAYQKSQVKDFDTTACVLLACNRICKCMGNDFLPYMSAVMPYLVEFAQLEPDKTVSTYDLKDSIHKVKFGEEMICIKGSTLLHVKSTACQLLSLYAQGLQEDFYPWISQAASVLAPLLKFYIDDDVRRNTSNAMLSLLYSAKLAVEKGIAQGGNELYFKQFSGYILLAMGDALYSEPETKICAAILNDLNKCLKICGPLLNEDQVWSIIDEIKHVMTESSRRKGELTERAKSEDFDAEDAELLREERELEEEVFGFVSDILGTLIMTFKATFLPFLDDLSSYLMPMRGKDKTAKERIKCINIFLNLVVYCDRASLRYYIIYLPFILESSNDENPDLREIAFCGLELCAEYGGYNFKPYVGEALSKINVVITHFNALEPENLEAYDAAVSALGNICWFHRERVNSPQIVPAWLNCLPIRCDTIEAKEAHDRLCSMVKRSDKEFLGPNNEHFPKIMSVFAEVLCAGNDLATEETANRMIDLLKNLQKTLPPDTWASAWSLLLPQQEMELESLLSPKEDANFSSVQSGVKLRRRKRDKLYRLLHRVFFHK